MLTNEEYDNHLTYIENFVIQDRVLGKTPARSRRAQPSPYGLDTTDALLHVY